jgi:PhnB protein
MAIRGARAADRTVTPHLLVRNASKAMDFYRRAFGAVELYRSPLPHMPGFHIKMRVGQTVVLLTDEIRPTADDPGHMMASVGSPQTLCGTSVVLETYVDDVDAVYDRAVREGAKPTLPLSDAFWGDRYGWVTDPFGHVWGLATIREELTPQQVQQRMEEYMAKAGQEESCQ